MNACHSCSLKRLYTHKCFYRHSYEQKPKQKRYFYINVFSEKLPEFQVHPLRHNYKKKKKKSRVVSFLISGNASALVNNGGCRIRRYLLNIPRSFRFARSPPGLNPANPNPKFIALFQVCCDTLSLTIFFLLPVLHVCFQYFHVHFPM